MNGSGIQVRMSSLYISKGTPHSKENVVESRVQTGRRGSKSKSVEGYARAFFSNIEIYTCIHEGYTDTSTHAVAVTN